MTKLSCLRRVRFGGVNWIPYNSRLSSTENLKSEHVQSNRPIHASTPDTTKTGLSCRVWCELSRPDRPTSAFSIGVCRGGADTAGATAGRTCRADSIHTATPDTSRLSRLPVDRSRRDVGQAGVLFMSRP